jgi:hypothetical protein
VKLPKCPDHPGAPTYGRVEFNPILHEADKGIVWEIPKDHPGRLRTIHCFECNKVLDY